MGPAEIEGIGANYGIPFITATRGSLGWHILFKLNIFFPLIVPFLVQVCFPYVWQGESDVEDGFVAVSLYEVSQQMVLAAAVSLCAGS